MQRDSPCSLRCSCAKLNSIDFTNLVWASYVLDVPIEYGPFYIRLCSLLAAPVLHEWRSKEVATILYSLGVLQCSPGAAALDNMLSMLQHVEREVPTLFFVNAMCGVALLNYMPPRPLLQILEGRLVRDFGKVRHAARCGRRSAACPGEPPRLDSVAACAA